MGEYRTVKPLEGECMPGKKKLTGPVSTYGSEVPSVHHLVPAGETHELDLPFHTFRASKSADRPF